MTIIGQNAMLRTAALTAALLAGAAGVGYAMPLENPVGTPGQSAFRASPAAASYWGRGVRPELAWRPAPAAAMGARPTRHGPATVATGFGRSVVANSRAESGAAAGQ